MITKTCAEAPFEPHSIYDLAASWDQVALFVSVGDSAMVPFEARPRKAAPKRRSEDEVEWDDAVDDDDEYIEDEDAEYLDEDEDEDEDDEDWDDDDEEDDEDWDDDDEDYEEDEADWDEEDDEDE